MASFYVRGIHNNEGIFWVSFICQYVRICTTEAISLPFLYPWSVAECSFLLILPSFQHLCNLNHTILAPSFETYLLPYLSSSYITVNHSSEGTQGLSFLTVGPAPPQTQPHFLQHIGDATSNSYSRYTCEIKGFHTESREIKTLLVNNEESQTWEGSGCLQLGNKQHFSGLLGRRSKMNSNS